MKFKIQKRANPTMPHDEKIQYAMPVNVGKMSIHIKMIWENMYT